MRRLYIILIQGLPSPKAIRISGLPLRTAYNYIQHMVENRILRRIGFSPAIFEAGPEAWQLEVRPPEVLPRTPSPGPPCNSVNSANLAKGPISGVRAPGSDSGPPGGPGGAPGGAPDSGRTDGQGTGEQGGEGGARPPGSEQEAARAEGQGGGRPPAPRPLDRPARLHHLKYHFRILEGPTCRPEPELIHWGPWKKNAHGENWYHQARVLFEDIGEVLLQEFPGKTMRIYLPCRMEETVEGLDGSVSKASEEALRIAAWLRRKYGYRLGLPEMTEMPEIGIGAPEIGSRLSGAFMFKSRDGSITKYDSSLQAGELDFVVRAGQESPDVQKAILWANAPTILAGLLESLSALKETLPAMILKAVEDARGPLQEAIGEAVNEAVARALQYEPRAPLKAQEENRGYQ